MKLTTWEGGMRAPCVVRWPGHIKPGTVINEMFASLDWLPTLVEIAGGPKGNDLNKQIMAGKYPGIVKTKLDGVNQLAFLEGKPPSARDTFFYYQGHIPSAVRYKNWKFYYTMMGSSGLSALARRRPITGPKCRTSSAIRSSNASAPIRSRASRPAVRSLRRAPRISTTGTCFPSARCSGKRNS